MTDPGEHYRLFVDPIDLRFWISECLVVDLRKESVREQLLAYYGEIIGPRSTKRNYNLYNARLAKVVTDVRTFLSMQYRIDSETVRGLRYINGNKEFNHDLKEFYKNVLEVKQLLDHFNFRSPPGVTEIPEANSDEV